MSSASLESMLESRDEVAHHPEGRALITTLAMVEGDILTYMERFGACTLRELTRNIEWPSRLVTMAAGGLVRERMIRAIEHDLEVVLERLPETAASIPRTDEAVPEAWGG